jgi:hypothetical protein
MRAQQPGLAIARADVRHVSGETLFDVSLPIM